MLKHIIIGIGTGRCGTGSLSAFLSAQPGVKVLHEGRTESIEAKPFRWKGDDEKVLEWIDQLIEKYPSHTWIGDIGMYYLNYADTILQKYPQTFFICMERTMDEVIQSFLEWTPETNHWMTHDGTIWKHTPKWDSAFPQVDASTKEEALRKYCTLYATQASELQARMPNRVKVVSLADFNTQQCRESILDFIQYNGIRNTRFKTVKNTQNQRERIRRHQNKQRKNQRIINTLWSIKRFLIGSPGQRWYRRSDSLK